MGSFSVCEVWLLAQCLGSVRNWQAVGPFVRSNGLERRPVAPRNLARFSRWPGNPSPAAHDRTYFGQTASDISGWAWGLNPDDWVWQASRSPVASRPGTPGPRMDGLMDGETLSAKNAAYPTLVPLFKEMACLKATASRYAEALSELESCFRGGAGPEFRKAFRWKPPQIWTSRSRTELLHGGKKGLAGLGWLRRRFGPTEVAGCDLPKQVGQSVRRDLSSGHQLPWSRQTLPRIGRERRRRVAHCARARTGGPRGTRTKGDQSTSSFVSK